MEVSIETLRKTIGGLNDEDLLRRWGAQLFTEDALPVAEAELVKRGLDLSPANIDRVVSQEQACLRESRSIKYVKLLTSVIVLAGCAGFGHRFGVAGVLLGGMLAWPLGKWVATLIDCRFDSTLTRIALGTFAFLLTFFAAIIVPLLVGAALTPSPAPPPSQEPGLMSEFRKQ